MSYESDIPIQIANAAHAGTSMVPEERGASERASYARTLADDYASLAKLADTDEKRATLAEEFERYRTGYKRRTLVWLGARAACMSTMITGASNFPVARQRKRGATADRRCEELLEFRTRALAAIRKKLRPEDRPIMLGDADASTRLRAQLEKAEQLQATMKACNLAIRREKKNGEAAQVAAMVKLGLTEGQAKRLLQPDFCGRIGFADYELTNNGANIRRLKGRLLQVETAHALPDTLIEGPHAKLEDSPADNRIRIWFPGKPDAEVRERLKRGGFRWTPSSGCWQAYRNSGAKELASAIAGVTGAW
jgi:hypothetical protein